MIIGLLVVGLLAGFMSSMVGIGGGVIIVPALVLIFGMNQKMAQGTSLLMLALPVAAAGAYTYFKNGNLDWRVSLMLAATFVVGGYFGGLLANKLDTTLIKRIFAVFMIVVAVKYLFFDKPKTPPMKPPVLREVDSENSNSIRCG